MRRCLILTLLCLSPLATRAAGPFEGEWTRTVEARAESKFVHHGIERAGPSVRPAAWLETDGLRLGAWVTVPLDETRRHEIALAANAGHTFSTGTKLELDLTHHHLRDARDGHPGHTAELTLTLVHPIGPGRVEASYLRDVSRDGKLGELAYAGERPLKSLGAFLHYRVYAGAKSARDVLPQMRPAVRDSYSYHGADFSVPYRVGGETVVTAGLHFAGTVGARPFWSPIRASGGAKVWLSLVASHSF